MSGNKTQVINSYKFMIVSKMNGKVLDIYQCKMAEGAKIIMYDRKKRDYANQLWYFDSSGYIRSAMNGMAMHSDDVGEPLRTSMKDDRKSNWKVDGEMIVNSCDLCLDVRGKNRLNRAEVCAYKWKSSSNQKWRIELVASMYKDILHIHDRRRKRFYDLKEYGTSLTYVFMIVSNMNDKVLDIFGCNMLEGAKVIMYEKKERDYVNQLWYLDSEGFIRSAMNDMTFGARHADDPLTTSNEIEPKSSWKIRDSNIVNGLNQYLEIKDRNKCNRAELGASWSFSGENKNWTIKSVL